MPATEAKYSLALELYTTTDLTASKICRRCGVPVNGFLHYIYKYHRDLMPTRHGIEHPKEKEKDKQVRSGGGQGQSSAARIKYETAIRACGNTENIGYSVSQIARQFGLSPSGLGARLRIHHPEILARREEERQRSGMTDNRWRGVRPWSKEQYAEAVELLHTTELTVAEAAKACMVSAGGLSQHLLAYHKDLLHERSEKRRRATGTKKRGRLTGNGRRHEPKAETMEQYREAVRLYAETAMTIREIATTTRKDENALYAYLRKWHRKEAFARRNAEYREEVPISETKQYHRATAEKYAAAIARFKEGDVSVSKTAAAFGLHPECFRQYLREHFPELHARTSLVRTPEGRRISQRSMDKYAEAIRLYETTDEPLKAIAKHLGLVHNSLAKFIRRNFPELKEKHDRQAAGAAVMPNGTEQDRGGVNETDIASGPDHPDHE